MKVNILIQNIAQLITYAAPDGPKRVVDKQLDL
jgi:hypothetical protein